MELSENEKILLLQEKEKIRIISDEIFDLHTDPNNKMEILKRMNQILNILSSISNYSSSKTELNRLRRDIYDIEDMYGMDRTENLVQKHIRDFCYDANSITFSFTKDGIKFSTRIKNLHIFSWFKK